MKKKTAAVITVIAALVIVAGLLIGNYMSLKIAEDNVISAESNVVACLEEKADLIPYAAVLAKKYSLNETEAYKDILEARSASMSAKTISERASANFKLTSAFNELCEVAANVPEIESDGRFETIIFEIEEIDKSLFNSTTYYNDVVDRYNKKVTNIPGMIFAKVFGFEEAQRFEFDFESGT